MATASPIKISDIKVGDQIARQLKADPTSVIWLTVTKVDEQIIYCNRWQFDRVHGAEIDHDLQWGPDYGKSGAFIVRVDQRGEA